MCRRVIRAPAGALGASLEDAPRLEGSLERERSRLHDEQSRVGGAHGVGGDHAVRARRTVEEHPVVARPERLEGRRQHALGAQRALGHLLELAQPGLGRHEVEAARSGAHQLGEGRLLEEHGGDRSPALDGHPQAERRVRLGIEIDQEAALPLGRERGGEVDRRRRLAGSALLIGECPGLHVESRARSTIPVGAGRCKRPARRSRTRFPTAGRCARARRTGWRCARGRWAPSARPTAWRVPRRSRARAG